jgi:hypothetical protein
MNRMKAAYFRAMLILASLLTTALISGANDTWPTG